MDRRQFLVAATCAASGMTAVKPADASASQSDLVGVCDIHLHAAPDSKARSLSEYDMALEAKAAGYRAVLFKSNDFSCHDRAYLLRQAIPGIELFGSLVLNRATGASLNVYAVEKALATTGNLCRTVWMPTLDAEYAVRTFKQSTPFIRVSDGNGKLLPETLKIMELCAQADVAFATGHSSPSESLLMAQASHDMGFKKCIITHPNTLIWKMTPSHGESSFARRLDRILLSGALLGRRLGHAGLSASESAGSNDDSARGARTHLYHHRSRTSWNATSGGRHAVGSQ